MTNERLHIVISKLCFELEMKRQKNQGRLPGSGLGSMSRN